jgi:spore coat polysaccharide biosynthesis protein SpsF
MRQLVAALACRVQGSRLYGKPLQNLDLESGVTILDHIISLIQTIPSIQAIVLGISEGSENSPFIDISQRRGIDYIVGDEKDVLHRLIMCGRKGKGTDVFRVTTESPFFYYELVDAAWKRHLEAGNDVTTVDGLPEGSNFEIYTMKALETSHELGESRHRSEYCSLYVREHRSDFIVDVLPIPARLERLDLRFTVDYPEDLVLCRHVYAHLKQKAPRLPLDEIIEFVDDHPDLQVLVTPYVAGEKVW